MTYEEYEKQEAAGRKKSREKKRMWLFIGIPILVIGTCNYVLNTRAETSVLETPMAGDYYILKAKGEYQPFKLKAIEKDSVEFLVPQYGFSKYKLDRTPGKISDLEKQGKMYDPAYTVKVSSRSLDSLRHHQSDGIWIEGKRFALETAYGQSR